MRKILFGTIVLFSLAFLASCGGGGSGSSGAAGTAGTNGTNGTNGTDGATGMTGSTGLSGTNSSLFSNHYDISSNSVRLSLNSIGGWVGTIDDIENTIIGIREPVRNPGSYPWVRPEINNTTTYINYKNYLAVYSNTNLGFPMFRGPFDIRAVPQPSETGNQGGFLDTVISIMPSTSAAQVTNTATWTSIGIPDPSNPAIDPMYRLTQLYYPGTDEAGSMGAFMTDCSGGTVSSPSYISWNKESPNKGFIIKDISKVIIQGEPFYVDVNFVLEIRSTQNELPMFDDMVLYGQINYHPDNRDTTQTPYIDWSGNLANEVSSLDVPTSGSGRAPLNILFNDVSLNQLSTKIRPQYSGDLVYKVSNLNPLSQSVQSQLVSNSNLDPSGAVYCMPIHWRAKCVIPNIADPGITWATTTTDSSLNPLTATNPSIYAAFTMFNTQPQFSLNIRPFNYNIILKPTDSLVTNISGLTSPGLTLENYGYRNWQSSSGFSPNMSITPIK